MRFLSQAEKRFLAAVGLISLLCLALFFTRVAVTGVGRYWFIPENLFLAWLSLPFAWLLVEQLKSKPWRAWQNVVLTILWLIFLPNSWYVLTDFIHVYSTGEISMLYDIVMISSLVFSGFILGFASLYLVHCELNKRLSTRHSTALITAVILVASFAIYLGRVLRWSTWDVVTNPGGLILSVSNRVIDPLGHPRALNITALFFILLGTLYLALWFFIRPQKKRRK